MQVYMISHLHHTKCLYIFFFTATATTEIYTLSLHDALPICQAPLKRLRSRPVGKLNTFRAIYVPGRSEEHTSELQSRLHLVCRLLLEKKNKVQNSNSRERPAYS